MATPEKMYITGKSHSIAFCMVSVCLFIEAAAMLRFMLKYCINHRQKHIRNTKIPMTALPLAAALVKLSVTLTMPNTSRLPLAMYGMADSV